MTDLTRYQRDTTMNADSLALARRAFLGRGAQGLGAIALASLLQDRLGGRPAAAGEVAARDGLEVGPAALHAQDIHPIAAVGGRGELDGGIAAAPEDERVVEQSAPAKGLE